MPIPVPLTYDKLRQSHCKGTRVPRAGFLPDNEVFYYTGVLVDRGSVIAQGNKPIQYNQTPVPMARNPASNHQARVLSIEIMPHKTYGSGLIFKALCLYVFTPITYRQIAARLGLPPGQAPVHTTPYH